MDESMPKVPGSIAWELEQELMQECEQADRCGDPIVKVVHQQHADAESSDTYLQALYDLRRELGELQTELDPGSRQEARAFWHELTRIVTGKERTSR